MVQSFNFGSIFITLRSLVWQPSLFVPHITVTRVNNIDFHRLHSAGVKYLVFDKDNTLTAPYSNVINDEILAVLRSISQEKTIDDTAGDTAYKGALPLFPHENIIIVSNSLGTTDYPEKKTLEFEAFNENLGIKILRHKFKKPLGGDEVLKYFQTLKTNQGDKTPIEPKEICVIGDRVLTDVLYANLNNFVSIHTTSVISLKGDNQFAKIFRYLESYLSKRK